MKKVLGILALIVASGLISGRTVHFVHETDRREAKQRGAAEIRELEKSLRTEFQQRRAHNPDQPNLPSSLPVTFDADGRRLPKAILDDLIQLGPLKDYEALNGTQHQRQLIALFEELEKAGNATAAIGNFLDEFKDINYGYRWNQCRQINSSQLLIRIIVRP